MNIIKTIILVCMFSGFLQTAEPVKLSGKTLDGKAVQIPQADKTAVLLVFWASWCGSCKKEVAHIKKLNLELNGRIRVFGVNVDEKKADALVFQKKHDLSYSSIFDSALTFSDALQVESTPTLLLIEGDGTVVKKTTALNKEMVTAIKAVLSKKKRIQANKTYTKPLTQVLAQSPEQVIEQHASIMGTDVHILIHSQDQDTSLKAIDAAMAEMRRIDDDMTDWRPVGQVWKLNKQSGKTALKVTKELLSLIKQAVHISEMTDGLFDVSYRGVGSLWDFYKEPHLIPSLAQIQAGLKKVGYKHIVINEQEQTVFLAIAGMEIGLGGIAKGYAVDRAVAIIESFGFKDFVVNAGGDLYVRGSGADQLWKVGIRHPRQVNTLIAEIPAKNYSIVTSGDYERFFIKDGKRYCHIVNPKTGYPAAACQSVTVLAKKCAEADALATSVFLMGPEKGLAFAEGLTSVEALIIDATGGIHMTTGFKK